ncbi:hypothetical protein AGMMS49982_21520 [Bacteroidia bacterium]|nr:hypothetical protein AGMMS49982_21520 [Bacteroidia bacterium]
MKSSFNKSQVFVSTIVSISFISVRALLTENNLVNISNNTGINIGAIQIIAIITSGFIGFITLICLAKYTKHKGSKNN